MCVSGSWESPELQLFTLLTSNRVYRIRITQINGGGQEQIKHLMFLNGFNSLYKTHLTPRTLFCSPYISPSLTFVCLRFIAGVVNVSGSVDVKERSSGTKAAARSARLNEAAAADRRHRAALCMCVSVHVCMRRL